jgi:hypothetical protein
MHLLVRPQDHVVLGVSWSSNVTLTVDAQGVGVLAATGADARLVVVFPPSGGSLTLPVHGTLSATSRLAFRLPSGARVPLTVAGVLAAVGTTAPILASSSHPPGVRDTAVELPWRVVFVPRGRAGDAEVVCLHADPVSSSSVRRVWRTRIVQPSGAGSFSTDLNLTGVDDVSAATADPQDEHGNTILLPLPRSDRRLLVANASCSPAVSDHLELSSLGGTLSAWGDWANFQWDHHALFGRDVRVRTLARGWLYPFGHRATYVQYTERVIDPAMGDAAILRTQWVLTITDPLRPPPGDTAFRRQFPFDDVRITRRSFADLQPADWQNFPAPNGPPTYFRVTASDGQAVRFPIECETPDGVVHLAVPLLFVADLSPASASLTSPRLAEQLRTFYGEQVVPLPGLSLDLVRSDTVPAAAHEASVVSTSSVLQRAAGDVHEVHSVTIAGGLASDGFRPRFTRMEVALPALRSLLGDAAKRQVTYAQQFLDHGPAQDLVLKLVAPIAIDFTRSVHKAGGLAALNYTTDALSRTLGPVNLAATPNPLSGITDSRKLFSDTATILGFRLIDLIGPTLTIPPQITSLPTPGTVPSIQMVWQNVPLTSRPPFIADADGTLTIQITSSPGGTEVMSTVTNFSLLLPPGKPILELHFRAVKYHQRDAQPPTLDLEGVKAVFHGELQLLEALQEKVDIAGAGKYVDVTSDSVTVHYSLPLRSIAAGAFTLRNVVLNASMVAPFDGSRPLTVTLGFSTRANPFQLGVLVFGGGGYIDVSLDHNGLQRLEVALEFGAFVAVDFLIASGEVHALGAVRLALEADRSVAVTGYLRLGGRVEVLGLLSVSIELRIELAYQSSRKALVGRARLVIEVDLTLWSDRVTIDSGEWVLAGGAAGGAAHSADEHVASPLLASAHPTLAPAAADVGLATWHRYRKAFGLGDATEIQLATGGQS